MALYTLGAVAALVACFTGRAAVDALMLSAAAQTMHIDHADTAMLTV